MADGGRNVGRASSAAATRGAAARTLRVPATSCGRGPRRAAAAAPSRASRSSAAALIVSSMARRRANAMRIGSGFKTNTIPSPARQAWAGWRGGGWCRTESRAGGEGRGLGGRRSGGAFARPWASRARRHPNSRVAGEVGFAGGGKRPRAAAPAGPPAGRPGGAGAEVRVVRRRLPRGAAPSEGSEVPAPSRR